MNWVLVKEYKEVIMKIEIGFNLLNIMEVIISFSYVLTHLENNTGTTGIGQVQRHFKGQRWRWCLLFSEKV